MPKLERDSVPSLENLSKMLRLLEADISFRRFAILLACKTEDGPQTNKALADFFGVTEGGMSLSVDRLEKVGLVKRIPHPDSRRDLLVMATRKGERLINGLAAWGIMTE